VKCELVLKDLPPIAADDPSLDGAVLVTKEHFARLQTDAKTECENAKPKTSNP
jgi:hypothetical protein